MTIEILKFYTPTCMPCRMVGKVLDQLISENSDIKVTNIDATEDIAKVDEYEIFSTPTLVFLKDGKEFNRKNGVISLKELKEICFS